MTIRWYKESFREYKKHLREKEFLPPTLENLNHLTIRAWLREGRKRGNKTNTIYNRYKGLKSFCTYLVKEELIALNPYDKVDKPKLEKTIPVWLDEDDARLLMKFVTSDGYTPRYRQKRDVAILSIFLFCGLRKSELMDLREEDINFEDQKLKVNLGKGGKDRIIHLNNVVVKAIKEYIDEKVTKGKASDYLFYSYNKSNRLSTAGLKYLFTYLKEKTAITKNFSAHTLRHTAASLILKGSKRYISS